jgi:excisionase family DNA binding protein
MFISFQWTILKALTPMADWITTVEAAQMSGYHVNYVRRLIKSGRIKGKKMWGRDWMVSRASLLTHVRQIEKLGGKRGPKRGD